MADNKTDQNGSGSGEATKSLTSTGAAGTGAKLSGLFKNIKLPAGGNAKKEEGEKLNEDLHRLTRTELLEMLIDETKEADRLREDNERLREELAKCKADLDKTASLDKIIERLEQIVRMSGR